MDKNKKPIASPAHAVPNVIRKSLDFDGRACRSEFWYWLLFLIFLNYLMLFLADFFEAVFYFDLEPVFIFVQIVLFLPTLSVAVRRMHDMALSGWLALFIFVPFVTWLILIFFMFRGTEGDNPYGEDPLVIPRDKDAVNKELWHMNAMKTPQPAYPPGKEAVERQRDEGIT